MVPGLQRVRGLMSWRPSEKVASLPVDGSFVEFRRHRLAPSLAALVKELQKG